MVSIGTINLKGDRCMPVGSSTKATIARTWSWLSLLEHYQVVLWQVLAEGEVRNRLHTSIYVFVSNHVKFKMTRMTKIDRVEANRTHVPET